MIITYHGHSCFKLKGKTGTLVFDPYDEVVGWTLPTLSADVVVISHGHHDHNNVKAVRPTSRRDQPFVVTQPGEYEVGGISVFGVATYHDDQEGILRGTNSVFTALIDGVRVTHLGDLGHQLTAEQAEAIGSSDVLLCPVGGHFTINPEGAVKVIRALEPSIVIPMHYLTEKHDKNLFADMKTVADFLKEYSVEVSPLPQLDVDHSRLPEETTVVVLSEQL